MFRQITIITFVLFHSLYANCQTKVYGEYVGNSLGTFTIHFNPNKTYTSTYSPSCSYYLKDTYDSGIYSIQADTILTYSSKFERKHKPEKYLIVRQDSFLYLKEIYCSDSVLPLNHTGRLNDFEYTMNNLVKYSFYSDNGNLDKRVTDKKKIITYYYPNGNIKRIETYIKGKKNNDWFYYSEDGKLTTIETYRKNKLVD